MVVDPCPHAYEQLAAAGKARGIRFTFLKTAEEALHSHPGRSVLAWMINMQLPCMTGLELFELLRPHLANVPVLIVDNEYDAARELSVLETGRLHYLCKPLDASWLAVPPKN
jgi:DNA-binding response OmpR family regulator